MLPDKPKSFIYCQTLTVIYKQELFGKESDEDIYKCMVDISCVSLQEQYQTSDMFS